MRTMQMRSDAFRSPAAPFVACGSAGDRRGGWAATLAATWSFCRPDRPLRSRTAAARLQGLSRSLRACHSLKHVAFRNLAQPGGPSFSEGQVTHACRRVPDQRTARTITGEMFQRPGRLSDVLPPPAPNDQALRARFNGALPPDLSVITKARGYEVGLFGGSCSTSSASIRSTASITCTRCSLGYENPPSDAKLSPTQFWNKFFRAIASR